MPYQVQLKRKNGRFTTDLGVIRRQTPKIGEEIECPVGDEVVRAKISSVRRTSVFADIGQPLDLVKADEL